MKKNLRFYVGLPKGKSYIIEDSMPYTVCKDLLALKKVGGYDVDFNDTDYFYYEIKRREKYDIGDKIRFKNKDFY